MTTLAPRFERRPVAANAVALLLAYAIPRGFVFASAVVAARVLGVDGFGGYGTAAALAVVASIIATLGMQPLLVREIARDPAAAPGWIAAAHRIKAFAVAAMVALLVVVTALSSLPPAVGAAAFMLAAAYAVGAFADNLSAYFQGMERMHVWTEASALLGFVTGVGGLLAVLATRSLLVFCVAPILGQIAALGWLLWRAPAGVRRPSPVPGSHTAVLLRALVPFAVAFIATTIFYRADVLILAHARPQSDVGIYTAARRFLDVGQAVALAGAGAAYPRLARSTARSGRRQVEGLGTVAMMAVPAAGLLFVLRAPLVRLLFGPAYGAAAPLLALLAPALVPLAVNMYCLSAFAAADRAADAARNWAGAAILVVILDLWLIPLYGPLGAALASLAAETALAASFLLSLRQGRVAARMPGGTAVRGNTGEVEAA